MKDGMIGVCRRMRVSSVCGKVKVTCVGAAVLGSLLVSEGGADRGGEADPGGLAGFLGEAQERLKNSRVNKLIITEAGRRIWSCKERQSEGKARKSGWTSCRSSVHSTCRHLRLKSCASRGGQH